MKYSFFDDGAYINKSVLRKKTDRYHRYSQTNNPEEELLRKVGVRGYLETCGPSAMCSCLSAVGYELEVEMPGGYKHQPESLLTSFLNDPNNYKQFKEIRPNLDPKTIPGNRVPQYYPFAVWKLWGAMATFDWGGTWKNVVDLASQRNSAVMVCLKDPGHYIAVIDYDKKNEVLIYNDSWAGRKELKNGGYSETMDKVEFDLNVQSYIVHVQR